MKEKSKYYLLLFAFLVLMAVILILFHEFLSKYSDSLMVVITLVYVIATIKICRANIKSAEATREQLAESKRQFDETKRLNCMPFLQLEFSHSIVPAPYEITLPLEAGELAETDYRTLSLKNIGNGTAVNITYAWFVDSKSIKEFDYLPVNAIRAGDDLSINFGFQADESKIMDFSARLELRYTDLLGNVYEQKVIFQFMDNELVECDNDIPIYSGNEGIAAFDSHVC